MSITEILTEVEKLSPSERAELIRVLKETETKNNRQTAAEDEKPFKTIFDVAPHLVGAVDSGVPDLATNKKYMEGFGTKKAEKEGLAQRERNRNR